MYSQAVINLQFLELVNDDDYSASIKSDLNQNSNMCLWLLWGEGLYTHDDHNINLLIGEDSTNSRRQPPEVQVFVEKGKPFAKRSSQSEFDVLCKVKSGVEEIRYLTLFFVCISPLWEM